MMENATIKYFPLAANRVNVLCRFWVVFHRWFLNWFWKCWLFWKEELANFTFCRVSYWRSLLISLKNRIHNLSNMAYFDFPPRTDQASNFRNTQRLAVTVWTLWLEMTSSAISVWSQIAIICAIYLMWSTTSFSFCKSLRYLFLVVE